MKTHSFAWKEKSLAQLKQDLKDYPVIALTDLRNTRASLFQEVRKALYPRAKMTISKNKVIKKALQEHGIDTAILGSTLDGPVGIIFSKLDAFELYAEIKKKQLSAAVKPGTITPIDLVVPEGDTGLPPGPALSELKGVGLTVQVKGPTIAITKEKIVTKQGEIVSPQVASVLSKLDIRPLKVSLNVVVAYEKGQVYQKAILNIDTDQVFNDFSKAYRNAFNLAFELGYVTKDNCEMFVQKAFRDAKAVAVEAGVVNKVTTEELLAKANQQAVVLNEKV
ncbi:MAG: 50S ribosomal protein L10 [Candidatus Diapherotrites archaeon]|nr:50S ribosomal protein L10 [Candidatus Diapherotrites archaeon]